MSKFTKAFAGNLKALLIKQHYVSRYVYLVIFFLSLISSAYAKPITYAYLSELRNNPQDAFIIDKLTQDFKLNRFKKFSGSSYVYYSRYNDKIRLIWAKQSDQFILVEILYEHKYHKSEWIPKLKNTHTFDQIVPFNGPCEQASASNNAPEIEGEVYYVQNRVIELDNTQEAMLNNQFPLSILVGSAGAGKTTLSLIQLANIANLGHKVLYVTKSPRLKETIDKEVSTYNQSDHIDVKTYGEFFGIENQGFDIGLLHFKAFAQTEKMVGIIKKLTSVSDEVIYTLVQYFATVDLALLKQKNEDQKKEIIRTVIGNSTCQNIDQLKIEHFEKILKAYQESGKDLSMTLVNTGELENPYQFIFVDEAQNFSYAELKTLNNYRLRHPNARIVYSIDQNQQIGSFGLKTNYLAELEPGLENNIFKLSTSYRNGQAIVDIANNITRLRNTITGGDLDAPFSIQTLQSTEALPHGRVIDLKADSPLFHSIKANKATAKLAIITDANQKDKAARVFDYDLSYIYTPEEIQGLEFQHVILFNPICNNDLYKNVVNHYLNKFGSGNSMQEKYQENKKLQKIFYQPNRSAVPGVAHINPLNQLYIAVTRARSTLLIYQDSFKSLQLKENCAKAFQQDILLDQTDTSNDIISLETTQEEWFSFIGRLIDQGDITRAKRLWDNNLDDQGDLFDSHFKTKVDKILDQHLQGIGQLIDLWKLKKAKELWNHYPHLETIHGAFDQYFAKKPALIIKKYLECLSVNDLNGMETLLDGEEIPQEILNACQSFSIQRDDLNGNINTRDEEMTSLMLASNASNLTLVEKLIARGADVNYRIDEGYSALAYAALAKNFTPEHQKIIEKLLDAGAKVGLVVRNQINETTPLMIMAKQDMTGDLVKKAIQNAKDGGFLNFQCTDTKNTALIIASQSNNKIFVQSLLSTGADKKCKNSSGNTALIEASFEGHVDIVNLLIKGEDNSYIDEQNTNGHTALVVAASKGHKSVVDALINAEANVNIPDKIGDTALMFAIEKGGYIEIVKALINKGADVNTSDRSGDTALMLAVDRGYIEIIKELINARANLNGKNHADFTALGIAQEMLKEAKAKSEKNKYNEIIKLLEQHGAIS